MSVTVAKKFWNNGDVVSVKLRDDLFTLAQMRGSTRLMFFDIRSQDGNWNAVDLNQVDPLFCVPVAVARMKPMIIGKVDASKIVPTNKPMPLLVIKPSLNFAGGHPFRGGNLIEMDERGETTQRPIVKRNLSVEQDADTIRHYELTNMWVVLEDLRRRLLRYFDTGVNWDPHKEKVFPGITPPPPKKQENVRNTL
jgi:hypothetical protein